ncbi:hypothetical protein WN55_02313 [Dufourea novaeangliae]|uniref:Uncharacterized protein n=1 Tax=Dufourea novaeangliae TaxID=178035 RepID=A0A154PHD1_DUFNO|nr:hypothetical protein WN55_02313 [Dufourea novaeangliae]
MRKVVQTFQLPEQQNHISTPEGGFHCHHIKCRIIIFVCSRFTNIDLGEIFH